jgi:hypothetical protein
MKKPNNLIDVLIISSMVFLTFLAPFIWVFKSSQEAAAYNRLTGKEVTTWDAMWVELRVSNE